MSLLDDIQAIALHGVVTDSVEYRLSYMMRWYSKTFHVPLPEAEKVPLPKILLAFWEERYEKLDEEDISKEIILLTETSEQRKARLEEEERAKNDERMFHEQVERMAQEARKIDDLQVKEAPPVQTKFALPEPTLGGTTFEELPQDIKINFNTDFFNELMEKDSEGQ